MRNYRNLGVWQHADECEHYEILEILQEKGIPPGSADILSAYGCENNADKMSALPAKYFLSSYHSIS